MSFKSIKEVEIALAEFARERDWDQFHNPKNLVMALSGEAGELTELFQWLSEEQASKIMDSKGQEVGEELADIFLYLIRLSHKLEVDILKAAYEKIQKNAEKYPVDAAKGSAKKYSDN